MSLPARCVHKKPQSTSNPKQQENVFNFWGLSTLTQWDSWLAFVHQSHPMKWVKATKESILKRFMEYIFPLIVPDLTFLSQTVIFIITEAMPFQEMQIFCYSWFFSNSEGRKFRTRVSMTSIKCWAVLKFQVNTSPVSWVVLKWLMRYMSL